jgi:hypothetical protein
MTHSCDSSGTGIATSAHPSDDALGSSTIWEPILYLDFDGVLHTDEVYWSRKAGIHVRAPGRELFEWMPVLENLLLPHPDVRIVLSTSWVRVKGFGFAKKKLTANLQSRVVGATFHKREMSKFEFDNMSRGSQIFADVQRRHPAFWFALDNDDEAWPQHCRDHLIKTEDHTGLSDPGVQAAVKVRLAAIAGYPKPRA